MKQKFNLRLIISQGDGFAQDEIINFNISGKSLKKLKKLTDTAFEHTDDVFNQPSLPVRDKLGRFCRGL